jgi:anti-sigma factor ChrR (cupin superfamily)
MKGSSMKDSDPLPPDMVSILLDAGTDMTPPPGLEGRVMARISASMPAHQDIVLKDGEGWIQLTPLLKMKLLFVDEVADSVSFLLKAEPGAAVAPHHHSRYEECLVLQGEIQVGDGLRLGAGEYQCVGSDIHHPVISTATGALVFLRTAIRDCPIPL